MSQTFKNIKIPYPSEGIVRSAQINDTVAPENSVQLAVNMNFDRIGAVQTRPGVTQLTTTPTGVTAFGSIAIPSSSTYGLFIQAGDIYFYNGTTTTSVRSGISSANRARFSQFLNRTWMVNGVAAGDAVMTSNGGAFSTTLVPQAPIVFPKGDFIQAGFEGRVWVADASKDVIYFTDVVQYDPGTGTYSFTFPEDPTNPGQPINYIKNFSPQDGETITGLFRVPRALLVFKQNHIYRVYGATSVDAYPAYNVGTYSQESIVQTKDGIYFHHSSGFYKFAYDSQPVEISRRIIDFVKAIPRSSYGNIHGVYDGFDNVEWYVGPVSVDGVIYLRCALRYTISTQVWTVYDYNPDNTSGTFLGAYGSYDTGTSLRRVMGTTGGVVGRMEFGNTDFGNPIYFEMIDRKRSFTPMYAEDQNISGINVMTENGGGSLIQYQTEKNNINEWKDLGTITENYNTLLPNVSTNDFNTISFRLKGHSSGSPIVFHGIEILTVQDKGLKQN